jgi:hypothetical protein
MSRLRVRIVLNEGGEGVPLSQLTDVADEAEKFFRYLAEDVGVNVRRADWLARNFDNRSVRFDVEREAMITLDQAKEFNSKFDHINRIKSERGQLNGEVSYRTVVQFTRVARALGPHEKVTFGLYRPEGEEDEQPFRWASLTKREAELLAYHLAEEVTYRGSLHGAIHNVGVEELWFQLRRTGSEELVRCEFRESLYEQIIESCRRRHARVYVHGMITARRVDREISKVIADRIKVAPVLSDERYQSFFGADPNYAGDINSEDFAERATRYEH